MDAGVVDQGINPPEMVERAGQGGLGSTVGGDVGLHRQEGPRAESRWRDGAPRYADHASAGIDYRGGDPSADSLAGPGNHHHLAAQ